MYHGKEREPSGEDELTPGHIVWNRPQCFSWRAMNNSLCFNCPWRPQASTPHRGSVIDRPSTQNTAGFPQEDAPSDKGVNNRPGDLAHSNSAVDIIISLNDHIMLYLVYVENNFVSRRHLDSTCSLVKKSFSFQLDWNPAAWRELRQPSCFYSQNWNWWFL